MRNLMSAIYRLLWKIDFIELGMNIFVILASIFGIWAFIYGLMLL